MNFLTVAVIIGAFIIGWTYRRKFSSQPVVQIYGIRQLLAFFQKGFQTIRKHRWLLWLPIVLAVLQLIFVQVGVFGTPYEDTRRNFYEPTILSLKRPEVSFLSTLLGVAGNLGRIIQYPLQGMWGMLLAALALIIIFPFLEKRLSLEYEQELMSSIRFMRKMLNPLLFLVVLGAVSCILIVIFKSEKVFALVMYTPILAIYYGWLSTIVFSLVGGIVLAGLQFYASGISVGRREIFKRAIESFRPLFLWGLIVQVPHFIAFYVPSYLNFIQGWQNIQSLVSIYRFHIFAPLYAIFQILTALIPFAIVAEKANLRQAFKIDFNLWRHSAINMILFLLLCCVLLSVPVIIGKSVLVARYAFAHGILAMIEIIGVRTMLICVSVFASIVVGASLMEFYLDVKKSGKTIPAAS